MVSAEQTIRNELKKTGLLPGAYEIQPIREKFGVFVFRILTDSASYVGKYFNDEQTQGRNEIRYYEILNAIEVPTLRRFAQTECLLVLEDLEASGTYRLAARRDVADIAVARLIAQWFRRLHSRGREYGGLAKLDLLDPVEEELCMKNIAATMRKSNSRGNPFWASLFRHLDGIKSAYPRLCDTITYNDFWWDNMALAIDGTSAIMFDYNCMYRKYAYADLRHILSVLTEEAGGAFLDTYGAYSAEEKAFEDVFFPLTGLIAAYRMKAFPSWAGEFRDMLLGGELMKRLGALEKFL